MQLRYTYIPKETASEFVLGSSSHIGMLHAKLLGC